MLTGTDFRLYRNAWQAVDVLVPDVDKCLRAFNGLVPGCTQTLGKLSIYLFKVVHKCSAGFRLIGIRYFTSVWQAPDILFKGCTQILGRLSMK